MTSRSIFLCAIVVLLCSCSSHSAKNNMPINTQIIAEYMLNDTTKCIVFNQIYCQEKDGEKTYSTIKDSVTFHHFLPFTYNQDYEEGLAFIRRKIMDGETDIEHLSNDEQ